MKKNLNKILILFFITSIFFISCSGGGPEGVVRDFLRAQEENDFAGMAELVDPRYQDDVISNFMVTAGLSTLIGNTETKYQNLRMETISNNGKDAVIRVTGEMEVKVLGAQMTLPVNLFVNLIKDRGEWYITL